MGNYTTQYKAYASKNDGYYYSVTFEAEPFGEGASRYAFHGDLESNNRKANGKKIVTKVFKQKFKVVYDQWTPDLTASKKAQAFAEKFNEVARQCGIHAPEISFRIPILLKVTQTPTFNLFFIFPLSFSTDKYVVPNDLVAVEDYIEGEYVKFNSNGGFEDPELSEVLLAFCHWTWEISGHSFMICDLQGVKSTNGYQLTDPAIHSADQIYGKTDLGIHGMEIVMKGHRCNRYCQRLKLKPNPLSDSRNWPAPRSKVYRFTLTDEQKLKNQNKKSNYFKISRPLLDIQE